MEKVSWKNCVGNEEVLRRIEEQCDILRTIKRRKANWIDHILRRDCLLKHVIEGKQKEEVTGKRGRRRKQLLDDLKEKRGYSNLKVEAPDRTLRRTGLVRGRGPVVRQSTE
jgi:hypothetical protein